MTETIRAIGRVSNFGNEIVVEFTDGVTARYGIEFLLRYRTTEGNSLVVEDEEPAEE